MRSRQGTDGKSPSLPELSRLSLENGNMPVAVPDFTRGAWNKVQGYRHTFTE
jgi:hypothetical protein